MSPEKWLLGVVVSRLVFLVLCGELRSVPTKEMCSAKFIAWKSRRTWVLILTLPLTSSVTLRVSLSLTGPHFLDLSNGLA